MDWILHIGIVVVVYACWRWLVSIGKAANEADWDSNAINIIDGWMRVYCRRFHRLKADPLILPENGGVIVVCNHVSGLEPLIKLTACKRPLRFMIAKEEYEAPVINRLFRGIGAIPVERTGRPEVSFRAAIKALKDGEALGVYPHGGFCLDDEDKVIKGGVLRLSKLTAAKIIPTRATGICKPGNSYIPLFLRGRVRLQVFPALDADFADRPDAKKQLGDLLLGRIEAIENTEK